jgi:hypothetical protein
MITSQKRILPSAIRCVNGIVAHTAWRARYLMALVSTAGSEDPASTSSARRGLHRRSRRAALKCLFGPSAIRAKISRPFLQRLSVFGRHNGYHVKLRAHRT